MEEIADMTAFIKFAKKVIYRFYYATYWVQKATTFQFNYISLEFFFADEYTKFEGRWSVASESKKRHTTFLNAKKYCSEVHSCFGVKVGATSVYSINFPIRLTQQAATWYIQKKINFLGIIAYNDFNM